MSANNISKKRAYRSKIRRITACGECHRRKQKCNREQPCNYCSDRGVPDICSFDHSPNGVGKPKYDTHSASISSSGLPEDAAEDGLADLSKEIGYVGTPSQRTAFNELQHFSQQRGGYGRPTTTRNFGVHQKAQFEQLLKALPSLEVAQLLIDVFFDEANWYFSVLERYFFDEAHWEWSQSWKSGILTVDNVSEDALYFPALLFQVLALGLQFLPPDTARKEEIALLADPTFDDTSEGYSVAGETVLSLLGRRSRAMTGVEADIMRSAWLKNSGNGSEAWYALGNGIRHAQDGGMHLEPKTPQGDPYSPIYLQHLWRNEHQRRVWACLFTWESHVSLQLGRPRMINSIDCTIRPPIDMDIPVDCSRTLLRPAQPNEAPSEYTSQMVKYEIACRIHKLMSIGAFSSTFTAYTAISSTHAEIQELLTSLPPSLLLDSPDTDKRWDHQDPTISQRRLTIPIIANSFLLALHRPHMISHPKSVHAAMTAAKTMLDLSQRLFDMIAEHQHKAYSLVFYTIDAGILLSTAMVRYYFEITNGLQSHDWGELCNSLRQGIARLGRLKRVNKAATAGEKVLGKCLAKVMETADSRTNLKQLKPRTGMDGLHGQRVMHQVSHAGSSGTTGANSLIQNSPADINSGQSIYGTQHQGLENFFDFDLFNEITNNSAFTSQWLDQCMEMDWSNDVLTDFTTSSVNNA